MRMRKKKHGDARRAALSSLLIPTDALKPGTAADFFPNGQKPLHLEIGCGKGDFVLGMAKKHPEYNFLAMERVPDVILHAMEKCDGAIRAGELPDNVRFLIGNANVLTDYFAPGEVDHLYLNFSDPWPKAGHTKRRLTYKSFLDAYRTVLREGGCLAFKTDNRGLFDYSLASFAENGWRVEDVTYDLHASPWNEDNVVTEYERNFSAKGFSINRVVAYAPSADKVPTETRAGAPARPGETDEV